MEWWEQINEHLWRFWLYLTSSRVLAIVLGVGFAVLAIGLFVASRTKWGRAKPLTKFVVVSVVLHVWLLIYAVGHRPVLPQGDPNGAEYGARENRIAVAFESESEPTVEPALLSEWDSPDLADLPVPEALDGFDISSVADESSLAADLSTVTPLGDKGASESAPAEIVSGDGVSNEMTASTPQSDSAEPISAEMYSLFGSGELESLVADLPDYQPSQMPELEPEPVIEEPVVDAAVSEPSDIAVQDAVLPAAIPVPQIAPESFRGQPERDQSYDEPSMAEADRLRSMTSQTSPVLPPEQHVASTNVPREYQLRQAPNRLRLAQAYGADADSEAAVEAGLRWLSDTQSEDGSWNAAAFGAGTETRALNEHRYGTGAKADTGVSGLALLAFLSAGHTHQDGEYQTTVIRGLQYLLRSQMPSGDMSGPKQIGNDPGVLNSRMYSHGIATLALAEAYAMTKDPRLNRSLIRAAEFTIRSQDPRGGGWRYRPGYPGDLSQFGWQAMALKSVSRSEIRIPDEVERRMRFFLDSCSAGQFGGLATYMPRAGRPSDTMTAESLACRLLLNYPLTAEASREAKSFILRNRPGVGEDNVYFWYYATLALFQLQDDDWRIWNQAMKSRLLETQQPAYAEQPGSWEPDRLWGGYGGRVYSTAMSCLCLEVYYRYLPLYHQGNLARQPQPQLQR